jgi:hypothetical protein
VGDFAGANMNGRHSPHLIAEPGEDAVREPAPQPVVGEDLQPDLHERHEAWLREQYLRDLSTLDHIERQMDEAGDAAARVWCDK